MKIDLYIAISSSCPKKSNKRFIYILEAHRHGEPFTVSGSGSGLWTSHQASLIGLQEALERIQKPTEIRLHLPDHFTQNILSWLPEIARRGFRTVRGKEVKNRELLEEIQKALEIHTFTTTIESHSYSGWMLTELRKEDVDAEERRM